MCDIVEYIFGARFRVGFTRFFVGLPFLIPPPIPRWCKVTPVFINGVRCYLYSPTEEMKKTDAIIVYIHGGGWCLGKPAYFNSIVFPIVKRLGITILSIDYKLAPEAVFPSQLNECEKVVKAVFEESYSFLEIDKSKIILMGDSAGGNLAASISQRLLRKELQNYIKCQVLIYPATNITDFQTPSYQFFERKYRNTAIIQSKIFTTLMLMYLGIDTKWNRAEKVLLNRHVSKEVRDSKFYQTTVDHNLIPPKFRSGDFYDRPEHPDPDPELVKDFEPFVLNPEVSPLLGKDLESLPEAYIVTCGFDILRDDGVLYAKKLESYGVPVTWNHYEYAVHGILSITVSKHRNVMMKDLINFLKEKI
ncbi:hypothetical protein FO519_007364 [Halicephalobus sp. NKZ332]|nr:hypothetical protein FO519_007364 [Halicephalobus sp. NKZ332]